MKKKSIRELSKEELDTICKEIKENDWINRGLDWDATPLEKAKYEICQNLLVYQQDNKISEKELVHKLGISKEQVEYLLFCHVNKFSLDELITYATKLLIPPFELKIFPQELGEHARK